MKSEAWMRRFAGAFRFDLDASTASGPFAGGDAE